MRPSCLQCVGKHLACAMILLREYRTGYGSHLLLALGHLEEASVESEVAHPELSAKIYAERKNIEQQPDEAHTGLAELIDEVYYLLDKAGNQA